MLSGITFLSACIVLLSKGNQRRSRIEYEDIHDAISDYVSQCLGIVLLSKGNQRRSCIEYEDIHDAIRDYVSQCLHSPSLQRESEAFMY